jgi:hypothetical protein
MWAKLDDKLRCHPKTVAAGTRVGGPFGRIRAYGTISEILSYCAEYLTGGLFQEIWLEELSDPKPRQVLDALVYVGFLEPDPLGWRVHHYEDHNPDHQAEKDKRTAWARQKREQRARRHRQPELNGLVGESPIEVSVECPRGLSAGLSADMSTGDGGQSGLCLSDSPSRDHARDPVTVTVPSPCTPDQKQRAEARPVHRVLVKVAHTVLDDIEAGTLDPTEVFEEFKVRCAKAYLVYDGRETTKALESAQARRRR